LPRTLRPIPNSRLSTALSKMQNVISRINLKVSKTKEAEMTEPVERTDQRKADSIALSDLITALADDEGLERRRARLTLVSMGQPAVALLIEGLSDQRERVRWEAAKALGEMRAPAAAQALVNTLEDESFGVRWLAADGLIAIKREGLLPLLQALVECPDSVLLREGAHHVLRILAGGEDLHLQLAPVLAALEDVEPALEVPLAAHNAITALQGTGNE
jgi:HEAT repeat protein